MGDRMVCGTCGHANQADAKFCDQCGTALAPQPAVRTADGDLRDDGEHKFVTVLFADIRGSMHLAETLGPDPWRVLLDRFIRIMNDGVARFDGTVNQYTGDGVMALFGAPLAQEDHAVRACLAAVDLRDRLRIFADELRRTRGIDFAVRLGLHSGDVIVGKIGDAVRREYTAQGHAVGLAQRIEQLAAPNSAFVSRATATLVEGHFTLRDAGEFRLKGVTEPVRVYELERAEPARPRIDVVTRKPRSRFVGRSAELATLMAAVDDAMAGRGNAIGIVGEAGVGKTRLCARVLRYARARGVVVAQAHCHPYATDVPLLPVIALLRSFFRLHDQDDARTICRRVRARLAKLGRRLIDHTGVALDLLGVPDDDAPRTARPGKPSTAPRDRRPPFVAFVDEEDRRRQRFMFMRRLIQTQSAARPFLLFVDDAHCLDRDSDAYMSEIVEALGWTHTLLLINYRPDYRAPWMGVSYWRELALDTLPDREIDRLLHDLLGTDPSTQSLRQTIRERTGGNPFFVEEVVHSLRDHGVVAPGDDTPSVAPRSARPQLRLTRTLDDLVVPPTVQALLAARIDRLGVRERLVAQAASVIGQRFSQAVLCHILASGTVSEPIADEPVRSALAQLDAAGFVRRDRSASTDDDATAAGFSFAHPLTQAVAYAGHLADHRVRLHLATARAIEHVHADHLGQHAAVIGHHYAAAGWTYEAVRWQKRAALRVTNITLPRKWRKE